MIFTIWNTMMGSTLLVMPACFRESGWLLGAGLAIICAGISQFTCGVIVSAGMRMPDPTAEFADLAAAYLGVRGWYAALFASVGVCLGAACAMHGYLATSLNDLLIDTPQQGARRRVRGMACPRCPPRADSWLPASDCVSRCGGVQRSGGHARVPTLAPSACLVRAWLGSPRKPHPHPTIPPSPPISGGLGLEGAWESLTPNPRGLAAAVVLVLLLPLCSLPSMRILARFNVLGVGCVFLMLAFILASAIANGMSADALSAPSLARPKVAILGTFALSFFIHSIAITIFRAAARPKDNTRNLSIAYALVTATYVGVGVSSNLCPPLGDAAALESAAGRNSFLSIRQPASLAVPLLVARIAVVVQCVTVYPVLIYAIRTQFFTALIYHTAYPGWRPVLGLNLVAVGATFAVIASGLHIADVIRFTGAFAALVCTYCIPARVHWRDMAAKAAAHPSAHAARIVMASSLVGFGCLIVAVQFIS